MLLMQSILIQMDLLQKKIFNIIFSKRISMHQMMILILYFKNLITKMEKSIILNLLKILNQSQHKIEKNNFFKNFKSYLIKTFLYLLFTEFIVTYLQSICTKFENNKIKEMELAY